MLLYNFVTPITRLFKMWNFHGITILYCNLLVCVIRWSTLWVVARPSTIYHNPRRLQYELYVCITKFATLDRKRIFRPQFFLRGANFIARSILIVPGTERYKKYIFFRLSGTPHILQYFLKFRAVSYKNIIILIIFIFVFSYNVFLHIIITFWEIRVNCIFPK